MTRYLLGADGSTAAIDDDDAETVQAFDTTGAPMTEVTEEDYAKVVAEAEAALDQERADQRAAAKARSAEKAAAQEAVVDQLAQLGIDRDLASAAFGL